MSGTYVFKCGAQFWLPKIESTIPIIDEEKNIDDSLALKFIELLLDKYYFMDEPVVFKNDFEKEGFMFIDGHIDENFSDIPTEIIYKALSAILRSIKRHTNGKKEYLAFAHQFISL